MLKRAVSQKRSLKVSEAKVQEAVVQMLELDGWRSIRTDPVSDRSRGKGFGEVGMPDYLFLRYAHNYHCEKSDCLDRAFGNMLWIEFKALGKSPRTDQLDWHLEERLRGALVVVCDNVDDFREWYKTSGLMRHQILS